jgi:hypothetical protein
MKGDLTQKNLENDLSSLILHLDAPSGGAKQIRPTSRKKAWTIMVYLGGDNNLAEEMVYALKCMFAAGSTEQVQVYAYYDVGLKPVALRIPTRKKFVHFADDTKEFHAFTSRSGHPISENVGIFKFIRSAQASTGVEPIQSTLEKFMVAAINESPAKSYALILSGHGSGSVTDFMGARKRAVDLSIQALGEALANVAERFAAEPDVYSRLNLLGMDSCQMSTGELASEVAPYVDMLVGAEGFEANTGWPYDLIINRLQQEAEKEQSVIAAGIVTEYIKFYAADYAAAEVSTDMSALRLERLKAVTDLLSRRRDGLVDLMIKAVNGPPDSRDRNAIVLAHWEAQGFKNERNVDLRDFCSCLAERSETFEPVCKELMQVIDGAGDDSLVIQSGYCGPAFQYAHGLSIYFPWYASIDAAGNKDLQHYATLKFAFESRWNEFLEACTEKTKRPARDLPPQPKSEDPATKRPDVNESTLNRSDDLIVGSPFLSDGALTLHFTAGVDQKDSNSAALGLSNFLLNVVRGEREGYPVSGSTVIRKCNLSLPTGALTELVEAVQPGVDSNKLSITLGRFSASQPMDGWGQMMIDGSMSLTNQTVALGTHDKADKVYVTRGTLEIMAGKLQTIQALVSEGRLQGRLCLKVREGSLTIDSGQILPTGAPISNGALEIRNERITASRGLAYVADQLVIAVPNSQPQALPVRDIPDKDTVRALIAPDKDTIRAVLPDKDTGTREVPDKDTIKGLGGVSTKIASMKNPPIEWVDCSLIATARTADAAGAK